MFHMESFLLLHLDAFLTTLPESYLQHAQQDTDT